MTVTLARFEASLVPMSATGTASILTTALSRIIEGSKELASQVGARSDGTVLSATIIVCAANDWMQRFHDRMQVILDPEDFPAWLDASLGPEALKHGRISIAVVARFDATEPHRRGR